MLPISNNGNDKLNPFDGLLLVDKEGVIIQANEESQRIFSSSGYFLKGKNIEELFGQEVNLKIERIFSRIDNSGNQCGFSCQGIRDDNTLINCQVEFMPVNIDKRSYILLQIVDLSRLQSFERRLFEKNNLFLRMANKLPGIVYKLQIDPEEKLLYISDGIKNISGYDPTAFFGEGALKWKNLIHNNDINRVVESRKTQLANLHQFDVNYRLIRRDGSICWVKDQGTGFQDKSKKLISIQGNILDITNMKHDQYSNYAHILDFEDSWKSRIATFINDNLHQYLAMSVMNLNEIEKDFSSMSRQSINYYNAGMRLLNKAIRESRKISYELIPKSIRDFGLIPAMEDLISIWKEKVPWELEFVHNMDEIRLSAFQENSIFIILRELLDLLRKLNVNNKVKINLSRNSDQYQFSVFSEISVNWNLDDKNIQNSLSVIRKRVQAFQGDFSVENPNNNLIKFKIQAPLTEKNNETYRDFDN